MTKLVTGSVGPSVDAAYDLDEVMKLETQLGLAAAGLDIEDGGGASMMTDEEKR